MKDERMKKLESDFEALKIAKASEDEELKAKDMKITNLQAEYLSKEEKKSRLMKLANRTKDDYEDILREYRDDFREFKRRLLRRPMLPPHLGSRARGVDRS
ncbi:hypothetical protein R1sor_005868 [Riccia sorocarpa]|uniref:Uncharacterized protein n=1 Tax=Riccia sorocarpa TaxID=122646 RepID=A0ABD3HPB7_9MARC